MKTKRPVTHMNMENLTAKFSHQTRLTNSRGFYLRVTEDNVEGVEDENDKYSEYVTKFCTVQSSSGFNTCRHLIKIDYILRQTVISKYLIATKSQPKRGPKALEQARLC